MIVRIINILFAQKSNGKPNNSCPDGGISVRNFGLKTIHQKLKEQTVIYDSSPPLLRVMKLYIHSIGFCETAKKVNKKRYKLPITRDTPRLINVCFLCIKKKNKTYKGNNGNRDNLIMNELMREMTDRVGFFSTNKKSDKTKKKLFIVSD